MFGRAATVAPAIAVCRKCRRDRPSRGCFWFMDCSLVGCILLIAAHLTRLIFPQILLVQRRLRVMLVGAVGEVRHRPERQRLDRLAGRREWGSALAIARRA